MLRRAVFGGAVSLPRRAESNATIFTILRLAAFITQDERLSPNPLFRAVPIRRLFLRHT